MARNPLAEVFGFPIDNLTAAAAKSRANRLCPYNNLVPTCTKVSLTDPLGVCSVHHAPVGKTPTVTITCPVRFRQDWTVAADAAAFFFPGETRRETLREVQLVDAYGKSAGNIDVVIVTYDDSGAITDFGTLEVQSVYITGNVRNPFRAYRDHPIPTFDWAGQPNYPKPDYLSARKRLEPQIRDKGAIVNSWGKKQAVAVQTSFFETLPPLQAVPVEEADLLWLVYDLALVTQPDPTLDKLPPAYTLVLTKSVPTLFAQVLSRLTGATPGPVGTFVDVLRDKLALKREGLQESRVVVVDAGAGDWS